MEDDYRQSQIAKYLNLSSLAVSKMVIEKKSGNLSYGTYFPAMANRVFLKLF